jgi:Protein of unknown function (DUF3301)
MVELSDLFVLLIFLTICLHWWNSQGIKQLALRATKTYCEKMDVQLLDEGVVLRGFWVKRDGRGSLRIWRSYLFEFTSTGDERYSGRIILLGRKIEAIQLDPHRLN